MGLAYLPDGRRMDYEKYLKSPEWFNKKKTRLAFDCWQCGICHAQIDDEKYETHHLNYSRLGDEDIEHDLLTLCHDCHATFHSLWQKVSSWESSAPYTHWRDFSLADTAAMCLQYLHEDFICGDGKHNLCNIDTVTAFVDKYFTDNNVIGVKINVDDVRMFVRNKRYEMFFRANENPNFELESWLDSRWGKKGGPGGNPARAEARRFFTKHKLRAMKRIYKENDTINILMEKANKEESIC